MIWAIVQLSTKETQFFCVMKIIDGGVLPEFLIEEFAKFKQIKSKKNHNNPDEFFSTIPF